MKNINHIKTILEKLERDKTNILSKLSNLNKLIENKIKTIEKMSAYQSDYLYGNNFKTSRSNPNLSNNLNLFIKKIDDVMRLAKNELGSLNENKKELLSAISLLDKKKEMMEFFKQKIIIEKKQVLDKKEQIFLDEITSINHRGESNG